MIDAKHVTKKYNKKNIAVKKLNMHVSSGEISVLLGPNGAGKSTLIKCICGLLRFDGTITIDNKPNKSLYAKSKIGYIPEMPAMYAMLTVEEHLQFIAKAYKLTNWQEWAQELLTRFQLDDKRKKLGQELSKGMQQKVSICTALLPKPKVAIFDEPFVGLDPHAIRELKNLLKEMKADGCAIIMSTHLIDSMEDYWDTTHIMQLGEIKKTCNRNSLYNNESLEDIFFRITEQNEDMQNPNAAETPSLNAEKADATENTATEKPASVSEQAAPATEDAKPVEEQTAPATEEAKPVEEQAAPATEEAEPIAEQAAPATEEAKPISEQAAPATEEAKPVAEQAAPATEEAKPVAEQAAPATENTEPSTQTAEPAAENPDAQTANSTFENNNEVLK